MEIFTATGTQIDVPLRDNAFLADIALARLPVKMVFDAQRFDTTGWRCASKKVGGHPHSVGRRPPNGAHARKRRAVRGRRR
jgi:hypothetical protein